MGIIEGIIKLTKYQLDNMKNLDINQEVLMLFLLKKLFENVKALYLSIAYLWGQVMSKDYAYYEKSYPNTIVFRREGNFYGVRNDSAIVLSNMFSLNLNKSTKGVYKTGIPKYALDRYLDNIELLNVNYVVINGGKIYDRHDFLDNDFKSYLIYPSEDYLLEKPNDKSINVGDEISVKLLETGEIFTYKVVPSYFKYVHQGMGGSYYEARTRRIADSDANISDGTINIDAPMIKALKGVNEKDYFEVKLEKNITKYQLLSVNKTGEQDELMEVKIEEKLDAKYKKLDKLNNKNNYVSDINPVRDLQLKTNCTLIRVENRQIEELLNEYRDCVIIFVNGFVKIKKEFGKVYYVIQYRKHKKYFEGSLTTRSINQAILWGILHAVKRINKKSNVVIVMPVVYGFKSSLKGMGPNANLAIDMYETLKKQECDLKIVEWYKGSKTIKSYIQSENPRLKEQ